MNLRHDEPLTPEEARAFLQVHAEREARSMPTVADRPRLEDLAESLGISPEEARSILEEARTRPGARAQNRARLIFWILALLITVSLVLIAAVVVPSHPSVPSAAPLPIVQAARQALPAPLQAVRTPVLVPEGFEISIRVPGAGTDAAGSPVRTVGDYQALGETESAEVRARLVDATLAMLDNAIANSAAWMRAPEIQVSLRARGGAWTLVRVPIKPFTLPLNGNPEGREGLRRTLSSLYQAGWADVLRPGPPT